MGHPIGKSLEIDTIPQNRLNAIEINEIWLKFHKTILGS